MESKAWTLRTFWMLGERVCGSETLSFQGSLMEKEGQVELGVTIQEGKQITSTPGTLSREGGSSPPATRCVLNRMLYREQLPPKS